MDSAGGYLRDLTRRAGRGELRWPDAHGTREGQYAGRQANGLAVTVRFMNRVNRSVVIVSQLSLDRDLRSRDPAGDDPRQPRSISNATDPSRNMARLLLRSRSEPTFWLRGRDQALGTDRYNGTIAFEGLCLDREARDMIEATARSKCRRGYVPRESS